MAIEHVISDGDTIQTLALRYFNDISRWKDIVDYNSLEYPYIVTDSSQIDNLSSSGYLTFTRTLANSDLTVYKGSTLATRVDNQGIQKTYAVVEDTLIPNGTMIGYLYVRCVLPGNFGNTVANSITEQVSLQTSLGIYLGAVTVINESAFINGSDATVKTTGQAVYIPINENATSTVSNADTFLNLLGGEDLALDNDGYVLDDGFGDMSSNIGLANITQAVKHRLMTESGTLVQHPEYGTRIAELIGSAQLPYINKLIEFDIFEALSYEDRVTDVTINSLSTNGTSVNVELTLVINKQGLNMKLKLDF